MLAASENKSILPKTLLENSIDFIYCQYKNEKDLNELVDILYKDQYHPDVNDESDEYYQFLIATSDKYDEINRPPTHEQYLNMCYEEWKENMIEKAVSRLGLNKQFILATKMFDKAEKKLKIYWNKNLRRKTLDMIMINLQKRKN